MTNQEAAVLLVEEYGKYRSSVMVGISAGLPKAVAMAVAALNKDGIKEDK